MFEIYKKGQGITARWIAAAALGALAGYGCYSLYETLAGKLDNEVSVRNVAFWIIAVVGSIAMMFAATKITRKVSASRPNWGFEAVLVWLAVALAGVALVSGLGHVLCFYVPGKVSSASPMMMSGPNVGLLTATAFFLAAALCIAFLVNLPRFVDYLIHSEIELRKVSWPTKDELKRQTVVVIFTIAFFSVVLLLADLAFGLLSKWVYKI